MNEHGLEQLEHFPTREMNTLDLILTSLPNQLLVINSPDKLSDHDAIAGTLKVSIHSIKKPWGKVYQYQKGDYESMRKGVFRFSKENYFSGHSGSCSVQPYYIVYSRVKGYAHSIEN